MATSYMELVQANDPEFAGKLKDLLGAAMQPGALDLKTKTLMILFMDATRGEKDAVKALAARARSLGASEAEIRETVRLAFIAAGVAGISAASVAFEK